MNKELAKCMLDVVKVLLPTKVGGRIYEYLTPPLK